VTRAGLLAAVGLLSLTACSGGSSQAGCQRTSPPADCADLSFHGVAYDELRPIQAPPPDQMQEIGDATYPACNDDACDHDGLNGFGSTDVWQITGIDGRDAVLGIRENSSTYVVYVRVGVDPASLPIPDRIS
jgi:hypothetical protein